MEENGLQDGLQDGLLRLLQASAEFIKRGGNPADIDTDNVQESATKTSDHESDLSHQEYYEFTQEQMQAMEQNPFGEGCPVQLRTLTNEEISQIPFMRQVLHLMNALRKRDLKLTSKGNLPVKMVTHLYEMGTHSVLSDRYEVKTEDHVEEIRFLHLTLEEIDLIQTQSAKLSLTPKGKKLLEDPNALMRTIMVFFFSQFNTGWSSCLGNYAVGNIGRLYALWLLHYFGSQWRNLHFYANKYLKAFPTLRQDDFDETRCIGRIFYYFFCTIGLCEIRETKECGGHNFQHEAHKAPILDMMFLFEEPDKI